MININNQSLLPSMGIMNIEHYLNRNPKILFYKLIKHHFSNSAGSSEADS